LELMRVGEVMDKNIPAVPLETTVGEFSQRIARGDPAVCRRQGTLILDRQNNLAGIITRGDVLRALQHNPAGSMSVLEAGKRDLIVAYPDEPLCDAIARMVESDIGRLPVVERENHSMVVGYLGRSSILAARLRHHQEEKIRAYGPIMPFKIHSR